MIRYIILGLILACAVVIEEAFRTLPWFGCLSPNAGLLFILVYALNGDGDDLWSLGFVAGLIRGAVGPEPSGCFILAYIGVSWLVLKMRWALFVENALTQVAVALLAGCLFSAAFFLLCGVGSFTVSGAPNMVAPFTSSATAALLAPAASAVYERSRLLRILLKR